MSGKENPVDRIARLAGIAQAYTDLNGVTIPTSVRTKTAILDGLGLGVGGADEAEATLRRLERLRAGLLPGVVVVEPDRPISLSLTARPGTAVAWTLTTETGETQSGRAGAKGGMIRLPALPMGYHRLRLQAGRQEFETTVIAAPARCFEPESLSEGARLWGTAAQVYSLKSRGNLGIGDFSDVTVAAEGIGRLGGSFLGLSPVHALFGSDRGKISPYSPSSRLFLEPIFVDPTAVEGFDKGARQLLEGAAMQERIAALKSELLIDHRGVWDLKRPLFDALWTDVRAGGNLEAFERFRREGGDALEAHAPSRPCPRNSPPAAMPGRGNGPRPFATFIPGTCRTSGRAMRSGSRSMPGCNGSPTGSSDTRTSGRAPPG